MHARSLCDYPYTISARFPCYGIVSVFINSLKQQIVSQIEYDSLKTILLYRVDGYLLATQPGMQLQPSPMRPTERSGV